MPMLENVSAEFAPEAILLSHTLLDLGGVSS